MPRPDRMENRSEVPGRCAAETWALELADEYPEQSMRAILSPLPAWREAMKRNRMAGQRRAVANAEARIPALARQVGVTTPGAWQAELQIVFLAANRATEESLRAKAHNILSLERLSAYLNAQRVEAPNLPPSR